MPQKMTNAEAAAARERQQKQGEPDKFDEAVQKLKEFVAQKRAERAENLAKARKQAMPVNFTVVDMTTGQVETRGQVPRSAVQKQRRAKLPNRVIMEGDWPGSKYIFDLETGEFAEKPVIITAEQVNDECSGRIRRKYSEHDQINAALEGGKAAKDVFETVTAHRNAAKALKGLDPIPLDFKDDKYWP